MLFSSAPALTWIRILADALRLAAWIQLHGALSRGVAPSTVSSAAIFLQSLVCVTRYVDLPWFLGSAAHDILSVAGASDAEVNPQILYNAIGKLVFLALSVSAAIRVYRAQTSPGGRGPDVHIDSVRIRTGWALFATAAAALCLWDSAGSAAIGIPWTFSRLLEMWSMIPQALLLRRTRGAQRFVCVFLVLMALYRAAYIANWWRRAKHDARDFWSVPGRATGIVAGVAQLVIFLGAVMFVLYRRVKEEAWVPDTITVVVQGDDVVAVQPTLEQPEERIASPDRHTSTHRRGARAVARRESEAAR